MKIKVIFAWYDLWIGFFYDRKNRWLYVLLIPTIVIVLKFKYKCPKCGKTLLYSDTHTYCSKHYCYDCVRDEEYFDEEYR